MKNMKRIITVLISALLIFSVVAIGGIAAFASDSETYSVGDTLYYGTYPQSRVTDEAILTSLNNKLGDPGWISYGYYSGTNSRDNGQMLPGDFMKYQDVPFGGDKYRAVIFDRYRPNVTGFKSSDEDSNQDDNGYNPGIVYWFKFEPIAWRVLDPEEGFLVCNSANDSQAFNNYLLYYNAKYWGSADKTYYENNYANSSIREWLNTDFINTAFSAQQQENIKVTEIDNSESNNCTLNPDFLSDKIFILSREEATDSAYGYDTAVNTEDTSREISSTDYAQCQGIYKNSNGNVFYWLRSPHANTGSAYVIGYNGRADYSSSVNFTRDGVCPAMKLQKLASDPTGAPGKTVLLDKNTVVKGQKATWEIITPDNTVWLRMTNNYVTAVGTSGSQIITCKYDYTNIGTAEINVKDSDGVRIWTVCVPLTYPGTADSARQIWNIDYKISGSKIWEPLKTVGKSVEENIYSQEITVAKTVEALKPAASGYEKFSIVQTQVNKDEGTFTVVTTDDESKIRISFTNAETGKVKAYTYQSTSMSIISCENDNGLTTWVVKFKFNTPAKDDTYTV